MTGHIESYLSRGLRLLPIAPESKLPYFGLLPTDKEGKPSWAVLAKKPARADDVRRWYREDPNTNIGIITGNGIAVADFDKKPPANTSLPLSPRAKTPREEGFHVYLKTEKKVGNGIILIDGQKYGDVKGEGGYVVAPPSKTSSGYEWMPYLSLDDMELATMPEWIQHQVEVKERVRQKDISSKYLFLTDCSSALFSPSRAVSQSLMRELFLDPTAQQRILATLGLTGKRDRDCFHCILPGHQERRPSGGLFLNESGWLVYRDWHRRDKKEWFTLAEVFASLLSGQIADFAGHKPSTFIWSLRLLVAAGVLPLRLPDAPLLPLDATPDMCAVAEGFCWLLACRSLYETNPAVPFAWDFAGQWSGIPSRRCGEAIKNLLRCGFFRVVGCEYGVNLFRLGVKNG